MANASVALLVAVMALVASCNTYEGLPAGAADAGYLPDAAFTENFNIVQELQRATQACVASETKGPASLQTLLKDGYVPFSEMGVKGYTKAESRTGKGRLEPSHVVRVSDPNSRLSCSVSVYRKYGYTALAVVAAEMQRLGYVRVKQGRFERYIGNGRRFTVEGWSSNYSAWAEIKVSLIDPESDRTCTNASLPAAFRQACN